MARLQRLCTRFSLFNRFHLLWLMSSCCFCCWWWFFVQCFEEVHCGDNARAKLTSDTRRNLIGLQKKHLYTYMANCWRLEMYAINCVKGILVGRIDLSMQYVRNADSGFRFTVIVCAIETAWVCMLSRFGFYILCEIWMKIVKIVYLKDHSLKEISYLNDQYTKTTLPIKLNDALSAK